MICVLFRALVFFTQCIIFLRRPRGQKAVCKLMHLVHFEAQRFKAWPQHAKSKVEESNRSCLFPWGVITCLLWEIWREEARRLSGQFGGGR